MFDVQTKYFSVSKTLLLALGLWPYQQSNFTRFQFIFLSTVLTTQVIVQFTVFISQRCTPLLITKVLSPGLMCTLFVIKYNMFFVNVKTVKDLLEQLVDMCNELKDENEFAIINEYGCNGIRYTKLLIVTGISGIFLCTFASLWSEILDIILPTNVSRSHNFLIMTEYFIDQQKYFYFILVHLILSTAIGTAVTISISAMLITYFQHVCGMLKIASYRIERAMNINILQNINEMKYIFIHEGLICAVNIHRQAMNLCLDMLSCIETMLFCLIIFGVLMMSINLFQIFQILSIEEDITECLVPFIIVFISVVYMFVSNYIAQTIMNHNEHIFTTAYNVEWYIAPLCIQKMILFLLQRNSKIFILNVGGLFNGSIETFATLVKTSVSYFTVIYSTQG
ncbi:Odorant receptor 307 [Nylanderia fulva]|uniref:Odorant receptor n=1 Tax=Nylanderia fulva TaxID=613905 RepID=A0A6G1LQ88_9HYME|nr:Odorant receptor 307 [Nylanderia fulva]